MNKFNRVNPLCPNCNVKNTATFEVNNDEEVAELYCPECGFKLSIISCSFADLVWAWNALPRPKPKAKARKARRRK